MLKVGPVIGTVTDNDGNQIDNVHYADVVEKSPGVLVLVSKGLYAPPKPTHETVMDSADFRLLLTPAEMKAFRTSANEILSDTYHLFKDRNGEVNTESDIFKEVMDAAVADGALTQERADELSLGKPI